MFKVFFGAGYYIRLGKSDGGNENVEIVTELSRKIF